jgi:hypothetical protein
MDSLPYAGIIVNITKAFETKRGRFRKNLEKGLSGTDIYLKKDIISNQLIT